MASIIGISGPSSSGKTTLTRLLHRIFNSSPSPGTEAEAEASTANAGVPPNPNLKTFIIHEDDFYLPDDRIPLATLPSGARIQDWDCAAALDLRLLGASLAYVRAHGSLPPRLLSKEDQNGVADGGVSEDRVLALRRAVQARLAAGARSGPRTVAFLEGFLLYAPEEGPGHPLREVHGLIDVRLFLPAPYERVKARRESRSGYVTIGPAPTPTLKEEERGEGGLSEDEGKEVDLEGEDDRPPQNFWTDPPGYVDDIVWPRYVQDHAWLLLPEGGSGQGDATSCVGVDPQQVVKHVGQGVNVRTDAGVTVAPGQGDMPMVDVLQWAVEEVMKYLEDSTIEP